MILLSNKQKIKGLIISILIIGIIISCSSERKSKVEFEHNGVKFDFVFIPKGSYLMGSPQDEPHRCPGWWSSNETQHIVTLTNNYFLGKYVVTQQQWKAIMGKDPCDDTLHCGNWKINYPNDIGPLKPVTGIKFPEAQAFCDSLSKIFKRHFRLPTEAEWEYACRAGTTTMFYFGNDTSVLKDYAVYGRNYGKNENVGSKKPNGWGLYDMHGNIWEWVSDYYGDYPTGPQVDPKITIIADTTKPLRARVMRGGCSVNDAFQMRSACRHRIEADFCNSVIGFRVLLQAE